MPTTKTSSSRSRRNPAMAGAGRRPLWLPPATAVLALLLFLPLRAGAGVRDERPNLIGAELLGRGVLFTVNYERFLTNHFGIGAGIMVIGGEGATFAVMPLYASVLTGDEHSLYLSAGATLAGAGEGIGGLEGTSVGHFSIGYHFQSRNGFFVRPLFTVFRDIGGSDESLLWPGVTIGASF